MWYIYTMKYYSAIKMNEIMPFAATWMDLEIITLSKSDRERQISYDTTSMWNLKNDTNELIYKTETDSLTWKTCSWLPKGIGRWGGGEEKKKKKKSLIVQFHVNLFTNYTIKLLEGLPWWHSG